MKRRSLRGEKGLARSYFRGKPSIGAAEDEAILKARARDGPEEKFQTRPQPGSFFEKGFVPGPWPGPRAGPARVLAVQYK